MINRHALSRLALIVALTAASSACASMDQAASQGSDGAAYMAAHRSALTLDTHLDTPANLVSPRGFDITKRYDWLSNLPFRHEIIK